MLVVQLAVAFFVLKQAFRLSSARTMSPFSAYIVGSALLVAFVVGVLRPNLVEAFVMPTQSMAPTINPSDRFVANKFIAPKRWDLVAYRNNDKDQNVFCKRLVGLPGERLRFEGGQLFVNDQAVAGPAILAGRFHAATPHETGSAARYHDGETILLGQDECFLLGDNLEISGDSRYFGPSPRTSLIGVIDVIYWPPSRARIIR